MKLSKIILYSDAKGRGVKPDACVEVSQRLTIMRDGHIWLLDTITEMDSILEELLDVKE